MIPAALPPDEEQRLAALYSYGLLDTEAEPLLDDITRIASLVCGVPISTITLVDRDRQWFKSKQGVAGSGDPREVSFCAHAILGHEMFVVENAAEDQRFFDNPLVTGDPQIRFYAGMPLETTEGYSLGTLCVIDRTPRVLTEAQREILRLLARQVMTHFQLRKQIQVKRQEESRLAEIVDLQNAIFNSANFSVIATETDGTIRGFNAGAEKMLGYRAAEVIGKFTPAILHERLEVEKRAAELSTELGKEVPAGFDAFIAKSSLGFPDEREWTYIRKDGSRLPVLLSITPVYNSSGALRGYLGIARDITIQKRLEAERDAMTQEIQRANVLLTRELETARERYRFLVEGSHEIIFSADPDGTITSMNQSIRTLGYSPEDVVGKNLQDLSPRNGDYSQSMTVDLLNERLENLPLSGREEFVSTFQTLAGDSLDMRLTLELVNLGTPVIIGRAAVAAEDLLSKFCESETQTYVVDNSIALIDLISRRCTAASARFLSPDDLDGIRLGFREMLMNAIEHGNLGISFEEKTKATEAGALVDLIRQRQKDPRFNQRKVRVNYRFDSSGVEFVISDQGDGFDFNAMLNRNVKALDERNRKHGRGIVLTRAMFDAVDYTQNGTRVRLTKSFTDDDSSARNPT